MEKIITTTPENLMRQARMTAAENVDHAIHDIDKRFGQGYAEKHPELVGAYIQTVARDFNTSMMIYVTERIAEGLIDAIHEAAETIRPAHGSRGPG